MRRKTTAILLFLLSWLVAPIVWIVLFGPTFLPNSYTEVEPIVGFFAGIGLAWLYLHQTRTPAPVNPPSGEPWIKPAVPAPSTTGPAAIVQPSGTKVCPDCAETVLADARVCRFCRHEFAASLEQERAPADLNAAGVQAVHEGASSAGPAFAAPDEQRLASDAERTSVPRKHLRALAALIAIASTIVLVVALSGFGRSKTGEPVESHPAIAAATASTTPTTVAPTLQRAAVQYNGIEQSAYADFAPPLPATFDLDGRGSITYLPSGVLRFVWENGTRTFIATKVPTYGGAIIYSHPDTDGHTPLYTSTYPWDPAQDIDSKFVDPLTYVGLGEGPKSLPAGDRLLLFLATVLVQPAGQGLFSYEGHDFVCTWTNGMTIPPAAYGVVRDNVHVECAEH